MGGATTGGGFTNHEILMLRQTRRAGLLSLENDLRERGLAIPKYPLENRMDDKQIIIGRPMTQAAVFWCGLMCGLFLGLFLGLVFWELT